MNPHEWDCITRGLRASFLSAMLGYWEVGNLESGRGLSPECDCGHYSLTMPAFRTMRNKILLLVSPLVYGILLKEPNLFRLRQYPKLLLVSLFEKKNSWGISVYLFKEMGFVPLILFIISLIPISLISALTYIVQAFCLHWI